MNIIKNILISVVFFALGISIFAFYLPVDSKETLQMFILILQIFTTFIFCTVKSNKRFILHSIVLIAANTANLIYIFISSQQIDNYKIHQTMDMLGIVMAKAAFAIWGIIQIGIIIIIMIEFFIMLVIRLRNNKKNTIINKKTEQTQQVEYE
ncbi:MAG: hypothetical protein J1E85_05980 [Ruminococcus sp.]|nr:hypothetical protein [Ruminococcus sp.]